MSIQTVVHSLERHAELQATKVAFRFHRRGVEHPPEEMTYQELAKEARKIGAMLRAGNYQGRTVLLLYPSCNEFVSAFFGCMYAGAIAVPAYPPDPARLNRTLPRIQAIARDCGATLVLSVRAVQKLASEIGAEVPDLARLEWIATDGLDGPDAAETTTPSDDRAIAFLQYTSGSTGDPKGVMVSYANVRHNLAAAKAAWPGGPDHRFVCWLPLYHDMGLIMNVVQTVELGASCVLLTPYQFLARPRCWLEAVSQHQATISFAPNFAYDLCIRKIPDTELAGLSLGSWRVAVNAAEPCRAQTMERFVSRFSPVGFHREAFDPSFGLAESTVLSMVHGTGRGAHPVSLVTDELAQGKVVFAGHDDSNVVRFVSNGHPWLDDEAIVVDPDTCHPVEPGRIGELWLRGPSVAQGYWGRPEATEETFRARLSDSGEGPFLRTGDLAFAHEGEFCIAGRLKDVIILRGANYYPHDIEHTAQEAHASVRPGCVVAFGVDDGSQERLVLVAETYEANSGVPGEVIAETLRDAIFQRHDLPLDTLVLIAPRSISKTSSGKVQRRLTRASFLNGELEERYRWVSPRISAEERRDESPPRADAPHSDVCRDSVDKIVSFILEWLFRSYQIDRRRVTLTTPFADLGIDSAGGVELAADLGDWLAREVDPATLWKHPTVESLARHLAASSDDLDAMSVEQLEHELARELRES